MTDRLNKIFSHLPQCEVFADVGCDHGYITKAMVESGKCKRAIVSDVSAKCLEKAQKLLNEYVESGTVKAVVSDGFDGVTGCDLALIAGMGGEEICAILDRAKDLPNKLVLQPMKNCDKVRKKAIELGYKIVSDAVFESVNKFYDLICLEKGQDALTEEEIEFGRDNVRLRGQAFVGSVSLRIERLKVVLEKNHLTESVRQNIENEIKKLEKYV